MSGERIPNGMVEVIHVGSWAPILEAEARPTDEDAVLVRTEHGQAVGIAEPLGDGTWRYLTREDGGLWPPTGENLADSRDAALIQLGVALAKKYQR